MSIDRGKLISYIPYRYINIWDAAALKFAHGKEQDNNTEDYWTYNPYIQYGLGFKVNIMEISTTGLYEMNTST